MNKKKWSALFSLSWFRAGGVAQRGLAVLITLIFGVQFAACGSGGSSSSRQGPEGRVVQAVLTGHFVDPESGELSSVAIGQDEFALADYRWQERELLVDGAATLDIEDMQRGTETVVPLRNGGFMTIARSGDLLEVISLESNASLDSASLPRLRIGTGTLEVLGQEDGAASVELRVGGVEDLPEIEQALLLSLGLDILLAGVEETDHIAPVVIAAAVAAVVGAAWMTACGVTLFTCINRCNEEFEVKCGFLDVDVDWPKVKVGGAFSFGCRCL